MIVQKKSLVLIAAVFLGAWCSLSGQAIGAPAKAAWLLDATSLPTNLAPGAEGEVFLYAANIGEAPTSGAITLSDTLPPGVTPFKYEAHNSQPMDPPSDPSCLISPPTIICTEPNPLPQGRHLEVRVFVKAGALLPEGDLPNEASVSGGGAEGKSTANQIHISATPAAFGFLPDFRALPTEGDGSNATLAASHPYGLTADFGFPTERVPGGALPRGAGHVRDISVDLPRGEIVNPAATPVLCTEAELVTETPGCPKESTVGTLTVRSVEATVKAATFPIYNMVPPPGQPAELGMDAFGAGIFVHVQGGVRSDGDYGISGTSRDILALTVHPVFGVSAELWGNPSNPAHDKVRGLCSFPHDPPVCSAEPTSTALLTLPSDCPGPPRSEVHADSWEEPSPPNQLKQISYGGVETEDCGSLEFEPTIEAKPTTNLADSPSGLDVDLHQRQDFEFEGRSTAPVKDVTLALPEGLVVNPSQADGLGACTGGQAGLRTGVGQSPIHFSKDPAQCPDAAKIGSVEVTSPLLPEYDGAGTHIAVDPGTGKIKPRPLHGFLYIAKPFENPFGSLLAIYLTIDDRQSGVVAKLAGEVKADPATGRLTTTFEENPQLPIEDVRVHLFPGSRAALRTPPACATYTSAAHLVPWSAPEGAPVDESSSFQISASPGGGPCPAAASNAPNVFSFEAGTISPKAGAFSPFVLKAARADGTQVPSGFEATLPKGLIGRLAGIPYCTEVQIAKARSRSHPNEGALELADPSCPSASEVGTVDVGAGAGPTPFHTLGRVYMAGPYKDGAVSFVIITPAVAGPFDLGTVVVRSGTYVDPETAQVRAVSDPLPTILEGIPLDVRSIALRLGRPDFTLNPTSCEPMSVLATATSVFNQPAALKSPFQVGGCKSLSYKPALTTRLFGPVRRGGHPRLRTVFKAKPGEANTARIVFALPHSEFIDQAHFRTICTRVQFAADQCPAGSVYGHIRAITPLLDYPLEGPLYLRSSNNELPDVVAALRGPASQPIEIDLDGRVDSINGGVRTTFAAVPDAPVTKAIVSLQGGKKGLFQNSTNICRGTHRASVQLRGQNGKAHQVKPLLKAQCAKKASRPKGGAKGR